MLDSIEFKYFKLLSQELQDMIWSYSLRPQMISLQFANYTSTQHASPSIGNDGYHLGAESSLSSGTLLSPKQLEPIDARPPAAFSVCRASRAIAQSKGYKTWRMTSFDGKVRDLLWNPLTDTIFFTGPHERHFKIFLRQFSAQASEIRSLALPHWFWVAPFQSHYENYGIFRLKPGFRALLKLLESSSLREIFVMVSKEFFESEVKGMTEDQVRFWYAPEGFWKGVYILLELFRKRHGLDLMVNPKVSVIWNFDMILDEEDVELSERLVLES